MSQFQVQFVLDQSTGKYLAEMHNPDSGELLVRTEALYDTQAAAAMSVIEMFKNAILRFPRKNAKPRVRKVPAKKKARKASKKKAPKKKASKKKVAPKKVARKKKKSF